MNLIQVMPEVAIILALFGMRFINVGRSVSAPWSNLLPSRWEQNLKNKLIMLYFGMRFINVGRSVSAPCSNLHHGIHIQFSGEMTACND